MDEDSSNNTFFSFSTPYPAPARDEPVVDDFLVAHIQKHSTEEPAALASASVAAAPKAADRDKGSGAPAQTKTATPKTAVADDQIHPLIRSRRLDTPEEIAAWIAERKAKYPTSANTRVKAGQTGGTQTVPGASTTTNCSKRKHSASEEPTPTASSAASTNPLDMLAKYAGESESSESDDDRPEIASTKLQTTRAPFQPSGLAPGEDRRKLRVCKYFAKGSCHKGAACPFSHPDSLNKARETTSHSSVAEPRPAKSSASLLEMLMTKDIDRENYRILQCIEYICDREFLGAPAQYELLYQANN